jgi:D-alanyl-D-alanine carboxypeptidase
VNYSLRDVFKAAMIASNNECAEQMARFLGGGNLQLTIDRMNSRAKELKMMSTYYGNPTGLPAPHTMFDNSSSPSDLLLLTMEMLKYNEILEISAMGYAAIENGKKSSVIRNHNSLTIEYSGEVDGLKTGYTKRAGFCLVATTAKCDHRLISIVLGCRGPAIRNEIVRDMVNEYYSSIGLDKLGPFCPSTLTPNNSFAEASNVNGKYITIYEPAKKIHIVKSGENLSTIALRYKCTTKQLKSWNAHAIKNNRLLKGQKLMVMVNQPKSIFIQNPVNGNEAEDDKPLITSAEKEELNKAEEQQEAVATTIEKETPRAESKHVSKYVYHTVAPGDTLFNIAKRYDGVSVEELKMLNKISDIKNLKPGTKLKVKVQG